jgi:hypothetical protein
MLYLNPTYETGQIVFLIYLENGTRERVDLYPMIHDIPGANSNG